MAWECCGNTRLPDTGICPSCDTAGPGRADELARRAASLAGNPDMRATAQEIERRKVYGDAPHPADDPREAGRHDRRLYAVSSADGDDDADMTLDAIPTYPVDKLTGPLSWRSTPRSEYGRWSGSHRSEAREPANPGRWNRHSPR